MATGFASVHGFVRNVPRAAMNNESRFHRNENGKGLAVCLGDGRKEQTKKDLTQKARGIRRRRTP
jgi:hypothetical protein